MTLLVTGGAGYIGSHTTYQLIEAGHRVIVLDNLSTGFRTAVAAGARLVEGDVGDMSMLTRLFDGRDEKIDAVLHFAALTEVAESVEKPLKYYQNNVVNSIALIEAAVKGGVKNFVFSSTAAVYGEPPGSQPMLETTPLAPINPYGAGKAMVERILTDAEKGTGLRSVILRYFNAAGARPDGQIGQSTPRATHLIKVACEAAVGRREKLTIFGDNYPTPDGTCMRDYIHVDDLASAHLLALEYLGAGGKSEIFNVGNSRQHSVLEVLSAVEKVSGKSIRSERGPRRPGDPSSIAASNEKIRRLLGWRAKNEDLEFICKTAYAWELSQVNSAGEVQ